VTLFSLSRELLSQQQHYDWGLRALKTSLGIAGRELREVNLYFWPAFKTVHHTDHLYAWLWVKTYDAYHRHKQMIILL